MYDDGPRKNCNVVACSSRQPDALMKSRSLRRGDVTLTCPSRQCAIARYITLQVCMYSGGRSDVCALVQHVCLPCLGNMTEDFEDALNQKQKQKVKCRNFRDEAVRFEIRWPLSRLESFGPFDDGKSSATSPNWPGWAASAGSRWRAWDGRRPIPLWAGSAPRHRPRSSLKVACSWRSFPRFLLTGTPPNIRPPPLASRIPRPQQPAPLLDPEARGRDIRKRCVPERERENCPGPPRTREAEEAQRPSHSEGLPRLLLTPNSQPAS